MNPENKASVIICMVCKQQHQFMMDEKYNNIVKEAEVLFDSILKDSLLVQKDTLYEGYPMNPAIKQNIEVCVTDNT